VDTTSGFSTLHQKGIDTNQAKGFLEWTILAFYYTFYSGL